MENVSVCFGHCIKTTSSIGLGCAVVMSRVYTVEYVAAKSRSEQKVEKRGERSNLKLRRFCLTVSLKSK